MRKQPKCNFKGRDSTIRKLLEHLLGQKQVLGHKMKGTDQLLVSNMKFQ